MTGAIYLLFLQGGGLPLNVLHGIVTIKNNALALSTKPKTPSMNLRSEWPSMALFIPAARYMDVGGKIAVLATKPKLPQPKVISAAWPVVQVSQKNGVVSIITKDTNANM